MSIIPLRMVFLPAFRATAKIAPKRAFMAAADQQGLPAHHSEEEIFSHPRFPIARDDFVDAILALYEYDPFLNRLLLEAGRNVLFVVIMCLHARYDEADRATWPTLALATQSTAAQGVSS